MLVTLNTLETFFANTMPATKLLIEDMWQSNRKELIAILEEYMQLMGENAFGHDHFKEMVRHAEWAPHAYPNPWKIL